MGKKEKTQVGTEVGERVKNNPTQIWSYLCENLLNSFSDYFPIRDRYVYSKSFDGFYWLSLLETVI